MWRFGLCKLHLYIYHLICLVWITSQFHATRVKPTFSFYPCEQCQIEIFECENFIQKKKKVNQCQAELEKQVTPLTLLRQGVIHPEYKKTTVVFFLLSEISTFDRNKKLSWDHFLCIFRLPGKVLTPTYDGDTKEEALWTQANFQKFSLPYLKNCHCQKVLSGSY